MASRIGNHIEFPNYETDELVEIGKVMCRDLEYTLGPDAEPALRTYMAKRMTMPFFANARTVRMGRLHMGAGRCRTQGGGALPQRRLGIAAQGFGERLGTRRA